MLSPRSSATNQFIINNNGKLRKFVESQPGKICLLQCHMTISLCVYVQTGQEAGFLRVHSGYHLQDKVN